MKWPDARGWIGIATVAITVMVLWMIKEDAELRKDEFFKTLATMIVTSGFLAVVAWAYSATKQGGELADKNAEIVTQQATTVTDLASSTARIAEQAAATGEPQDVNVVNTPDEAVPTTPGKKP